MKPYKRHLILCTGSDASDWEAKIEKVEGSFAAALKSCINQYESNIPGKILITSAGEDSKGVEIYTEEQLDILLLPV